jgi:hypothetical protein
MYPTFCPDLGILDKVGFGLLRTRGSKLFFNPKYAVSKVVYPPTIYFPSRYVEEVFLVTPPVTPLTQEEFCNDCAN